MREAKKTMMTSEQIRFLQPGDLIERRKISPGGRQVLQSDVYIVTDVKNRKVFLHGVREGAGVWISHTSMSSDNVTPSFGGSYQWHLISPALPAEEQKAE